MKNSHSSMGKPKKSTPEWYLGLKLQTPILVKIISQIIKKIAVMIMAEKTALPLFMYLILGSKLYKNGIRIEKMFK